MYRIWTVRGYTEIRSYFYTQFYSWAELLPIKVYLFLLQLINFETVCILLCGNIIKKSTDCASK